MAAVAAAVTLVPSKKFKMLQLLEMLHLLMIDFVVKVPQDNPFEHHLLIGVESGHEHGTPCPY